MSQNLDTQIIYDKNGKPIPQYLDITDKSGGSDGTMKPITGQNGAQNMRLTGSIIEKYNSDNIITLEPSETIRFIDNEIAVYPNLKIYIITNPINYEDISIRVATRNKANQYFIQSHSVREFESSRYKVATFTKDHFGLVYLAEVVNVGHETVDITAIVMQEVL